MVSFCHIRTDSYISDHHPIVRHQLYKLPSFKEKKKKKLRSFLVPLHLGWRRHQCPQFCCLSQSLGCFSFVFCILSLPWFTDQSPVS